MQSENEELDRERGLDDEVIFVTRQRFEICDRLKLLLEYLTYWSACLRDAGEWERQ